MSGYRTHPVLPCADLDEAIAFYNALGFAVTYSQQRPNPYAVVELDDMAIHLNGIEGFDPATSYASVIVTVPELEQLHDSVKEGLRASFGKVPVKGVPRLLPPRRKAGTATGFSAVDVGGNWLRFYATGASGEEAPRTGLGRVIDFAAREGDARRRGPHDRCPRRWAAALPKRARCRAGRGTGLPRRTVEACLRLGSGVAASERDHVLDRFAALDARLRSYPAGEVELELSVKDRDGSDQKTTLEGWIAGRERVVATSSRIPLDQALTEVRVDLIRQLSDAKNRTEPRQNRQRRDTSS